MTRTKSTFLALLAVLLSPMAANADQIVLDYPSEDALLSGSCSGPLGAGGGGRCFVAGDTLTETFLGTGLASAATSRWQFSMSNYTALGVENNFNVLINSILVGTYGFVSDGVRASILDFDLSFDHAPIAGESYTLQLVATTTVPPGLSSWNWVSGGTVTLSDVHSVPEPGTLALLSLGLLGVGAARRRKHA